MGQMPADSLALAVRVSCKENAITVLCIGFQLFDDFFLTLDADIMGRIVMLYINAQLRSGQIIDMAHAGGDFIAIPQIFANGFRLGRRLHDH